MQQGKLYLIPSPLAPNSLDTIPLSVLNTILTLNEWIVEDIKTAQKYIYYTAKFLNKKVLIDNIIFHTLNEHTQPNDITHFLDTAKVGGTIGLLSDAGCPAIADPGTNIILLAHQLDIQVIPLVGPSSILLTIMASGLNSQNFAFNGYLPIKNPQRQKTIKDLEKIALQFHQAQFFIETPYRNQALLTALLCTLKSNTLLTIASNLTDINQNIKTQPVANWNKNIPSLNKIPTVFGIAIL